MPNVPTYLASEEADKKYILENLPELVVKAANESGGYGMLMGPKATKAEIEEFRKKIDGRAAQLHRAADDFSFAASDACGDGKFRRPARGFAAVSSFPAKKSSIVPGGLTRVALRKGSLVVNSSQGGGSKDTWVLYGDE